MKKQLKTITSILLFGGFIFLGYSSGEESDIHAATSLEEAKEVRCFKFLKTFLRRQL